MSESALSLAKQLSELLLLEFEALKVQDLDRFEALKVLLVDCRDLHRRNAVLIERKLDTIRGTLHSLHTGESGSPVEVYDRLGQVARFSKGRGYQDI